MLLDANLLVYAHASSMPQHAAARRWLDDRLNGTAPVGLPWSSLLSFVRLVSNPRVFEKAESVEVAWKQAEKWLDAPTAWIPGPGERHREILDSLIKSGGLRANLAPDAHLAALAMEHGLILYSTDGDFARFKDLRWENPLAGPAA